MSSVRDETIESGARLDINGDVGCPCQAQDFVETSIA
jgi:hypothetical protein